MTQPTRRKSLAQHIVQLAGGFEPAMVVLEDMCAVAVRYGRDAHYVIRQCVNLGLGREGLPELHEACGYNDSRCLKALLAYEDGLIHRDPLIAEIFRKNEVTFRALERQVDGMLGKPQKPRKRLRRETALA